jgi:hypothetical protein
LLKGTGVLNETEPMTELAPSRGVPARRWVLAASLLFLNLVDILLTRTILGRGGVEANPLMAPIIHHPAYPVIIKVMVSLGVGGLLFASPTDSKLSDRAVLAVIVGYVAITVWNLRVLAFQ